MLARRAQICVLVMSFAMRSLETKLSVVPGLKCSGQVIADCVDMIGLYNQDKKLGESMRNKKNIERASCLSST